MYISSGIPLDNLDKEIIQIVSKDGRISYTDLGQLLHVSSGTIANRIQKMVDSGILSFVGVVHPFHSGLHALAMIGLKVDPRKIDEVASRLIEYPAVRFIVACTGDYQIVIEVVEESNDDLLKFLTNELSKIEGVQAVSVSNEMRLYKNVFNFTRGENV